MSKYVFNPFSGTLDLVSEEDLSGYVPYSGATGNVDLGDNDFIVDTDTLFVDSVNGNVGIGTTSPDVKLHVNGTGSETIRVQKSTGAITDMIAGSSVGTVGTFSNHDFNLRTNNQDRVTIDTDGNVGIGTTSPGELLDIVDTGIGIIRGTSATSGGAFLFEGRASRGSVSSRTINADGDPVGIFRMTGYDGNSFETLADIRGVVDGTPGDGDMPGRIEFYTAADGGTTLTQQMVIDKDGNVGIGTTDPSTKLHNAGAYTQEPLSSDPTDPSDGNSVQWVSDGTGSYNAGDVCMKINVGGTVKMVRLVDFNSL